MLGVELTDSVSFAICMVLASSGMLITEKKNKELNNRAYIRKLNIKHLNPTGKANEGEKKTLNEPLPC